MSLHIKIRRDVWGTWSVHGLSSVPVSDLPSLSASIDYARNALRSVTSATLAAHKLEKRGNQAGQLPPFARNTIIESTFDLSNKDTCH